MHFILLLKIIFAVGNHLPVAQPSAWERKRKNTEKQLKNICAVQLHFLFCVLPGVNFVFKLTYQWGCFQAALFSHLCRARLQRDKVSLSGQCYARPRSKDYPELQAFEGSKTKRETLASKPGHLLEVIHYKK